MEDFQKMPRLPNIKQQNRLDMLDRKEKRLLKRIGYMKEQQKKKIKRVPIDRSVRDKIYYEKNKEKINEKRREKVSCKICKKEISRNNINKHQLSHQIN